MPYTAYAKPDAKWNPVAGDETALEGESEISAATIEGATTPQANSFTKGTDISRGQIDVKLVTAADADSTTDINSAATTVNDAGFDDTVTSVTVTDGSVIPDPDNVDHDVIVICESEQLRVTDVTGNVWTIDRGWDGTTAATHANTTAIAQYNDEQTETLDVDSGAVFAAGDVVKIETGGTELIKISAISTNRLTVIRGYKGTTPAVIADNANVFLINGENQVDTALAAASTSATLRQQGEGVYDLAP